MGDTVDPVREAKMNKTRSMILLLGATGAGKSTFASMLSDDVETIDIGHTLDSGTSRTTLYLCKLGATRFYIVDTPGFDDKYMSDTQVLANMCLTLTDQFHSGLELKGIVFLHKITENRFAGTARRTLNILSDLCGPRAFRSVVLATTMWGDTTASNPPPEALLKHEKELSRKPWRQFEENGASIERFQNNRDSAKLIVASLLGRDGVVLRVQEELSGEERSLGETTVAVNMDIESNLDDEIRTEFSELDRYSAEIVEAIACESDEGVVEEVIAEKQEAKEKVEGKLRRLFRDKKLLNTKLTPEVKKTHEDAKKKYGGLMLAGKAFAILLSISSVVVNILSLSS